MKLTIEIIDIKHIKILEQNTGHTGFVSPPLYDVDHFEICQRCYPAYDNSNIPYRHLYIHGSEKWRDTETIYIGNDLFLILYHLKKAFSNFKVVMPKGKVKLCGR